MEEQLTLENLTQAVLDRVWDIWYRHGYPGLQPHRYPTPTVDRVRSIWRTMRVSEHRLGIKGWRHAKLWIRPRLGVALSSGSTSIYFSAGANDSGMPPGLQEKNKRIIEAIARAWEEAGLPVRK